MECRDRMKLLVLGDLHVGSADGVVQPGVRIEEGDETHSRALDRNKTQKFIWKHWKKMVEDVGHIDACLVNGDIVDGKNYNGEGLGTWTTDIMLQADTAIGLLDMIKADQWYVTKGTKYHVGQNMNADKYIARAMGGEFGVDLALEFENLRLHASHKTTYSSSTWYRTTPIAKELLVAELNKEEYGKYHIIIRSHAHYYCFAGFGSSMGFITPCWKGRDEYAREMGLTCNPHLGYILLNIENSRFGWKDYTFTLPTDCLTKVCQVKSTVTSEA